MFETIICEMPGADLGIVSIEAAVHSYLCQ